MFRWLTEKVESLGGSESETALQRIVRQELGNADEATVVSSHARVVPVPGRVDAPSVAAAGHGLVEDLPSELDEW